MTNSIPYLDDVLRINDALLGLPALPLVFLGALVLGYALQAVPIYPNRWIPLGVFTFGILANVALSEGKDIVRSLILGMIAGAAAWYVNRKWLGSWVDEKIFKRPNGSGSNDADGGGGGTPPPAALWLVLGALAFGAGCGTVDRTAFNTTKTAVTIADAGMQTFATYYRAAWNDPAAFRTTTNALAAQRKQLSALSYQIGLSAELAETLRRSYKTNAALKPHLLATLQTLGDSASNIVWTVNTITSSK